MARAGAREVVAEVTDSRRAVTAAARRGRSSISMRTIRGTDCRALEASLASHAAAGGPFAIGNARVEYRRRSPDTPRTRRAGMRDRFQLLPHVNWRVRTTLGFAAQPRNQSGGVGRRWGRRSSTKQGHSQEARGARWTRTPRRRIGWWRRERTGRIDAYKVEVKVKVKVEVDWEAE